MNAKLAITSLICRKQVAQENTPSSLLFQRFCKPLLSHSLSQNNYGFIFYLPEQELPLDLLLPSLSNPPVLELCFFKRKRSCSSSEGRHFRSAAHLASRRHRCTRIQGKRAQEQTHACMHASKHALLIPEKKSCRSFKNINCGGETQQICSSQSLGTWTPQLAKMLTPG